MTRYFATASLLLSLVGLPALVGCDKTVAEHKTEEKKADGTTVTDKTKTTQSPDGSTKTEAKHEENK